MEEGETETDSSLVLDKASSHFFFHTSSKLAPSSSSLSVAAVFGYSMQNGLCLRAVA